jgi:metal-responsive CopG/Arc/MetJ family transcriptional regulator
MANVTITLPIDVLDKLDDLIEKRRVVSRSQAVRDAVERYLKSYE